MRLRVGLVTGCVQRAFFGDVNEATARVLAPKAARFTRPRHRDAAARWRSMPAKTTTARAVRAGTRLTHSNDRDVDAIAVNAAGCGSAMKEYGHLLRNDPAWAERARAFSSKVRDVTEILAACDPPRAPRRELKLPWPITTPVISRMRKACAGNRGRCWHPFLA